MRFARKIIISAFTLSVMALFASCSTGRSIAEDGLVSQTDATLESVFDTMEATFEASEFQSSESSLTSSQTEEACKSTEAASLATKEEASADAKEPEVFETEEVKEVKTEQPVTSETEAPVETKSQEAPAYEPIEGTAEEFIGIVCTSTDYLNLRKENNPQDGVLTVIPNNSKILIKDFTAIYDNYYYCKYNDTYGLVSKQYVQPTEVDLYAAKDTVVLSAGAAYDIKEGECLTMYESESGYISKSTLKPISYVEDDFLTYSEFIRGKVKEEDLELITSFSTYYSHAENYLTKGYNITLCCSEIDGTIIKDGANFNWFEVVGNTGKAEGYKIANIYSNGKVEKGYGGGVCQVASTVYNCALNLNLEIIERHAHGLPVTYVDYYAGKDATVGDIGGPNLIFKNNLGYDIMFKAFTSEIPENDIASRGMVTIEVYKVNM